ncbi:Transcription factor [Colletotrichum fructicola]|uniref:Transcription factor MST12 n=1 Tax=Colletotrichum fructicola (strain Nara gc5) TaxID=1213859 RepID=A0A7J6J9R5_COLFN|nr:Transcription factor [Colletotrichum fructicola]KAE9576998.1 Transcription factor [Colletotrichum fructicola]KAF4416598.1 Transcription factor steA [Colletotrichum fructicola]KAF4485318.1 Transcription factor steA [Colletotrichum fructicola Nara gc5]KAF5499129.1 Transcription factor steA [Colletotrichum fructicola]
MYSQHAAAGMAPQKPETFMLSTEAQQALPHDAQVALQQVDNLKYFLISAPVDWQPDQYIRRFLLPTGEYVSCVLWNNLFHISGTDIVRCLSFRFQAFGRPVKNSKKFEEGIFSDLRNLKSGTDASLEEPKSPFLDFLYKNNCIRTQKKQKVFYWYSVPHDRLFLDALERDLKREKMGQEATTVAVSEPALSFQYDSSQSLYEQLTKAQQANSSSFNAQQMIPQSVAPLADGMEAMVPYGAMGMHQQMPPQQMVKREPDFARVQYNQNGVPITQGHQRHASMPAYGLEYSPAPSFVSSQYEDYSNRGISFEPITPPQQALGMAAEPAYIANEETGLYTAIPDHMGGGVNGLNGMIQLPPSNLAGPQFSRAYGTNNVYSVIEGSPTYKQRRRRSSIPPSMSAIAAATAQAQAQAAAQQQQQQQHRPSDLRRSVSASVGPVAEGDESADNSPPGLAYSSSAMSMVSQQHKEMLEMSRHGTPLSTVEGSPALNPMSLQQQDFSHLTNDDLSGDGSMNGASRPGMQGPNGVVRRARSATVMELGPYPQKSHSCPIPTCGRLFKRLEHLKRHVRTHTQERPYICPYCSKAFSRSDNLAQHKRTHDRGENGEAALNFSGEEEEEYSGEDQLGSLEEASPSSENAYVTASMNGAVNSSSTPTSAGMAPAPTFNSLQTLSMPMTISQPAVNASAIM